MTKLVKCHYCQQMIDKDLAERFEDKNFHKDCCEKYKDKKEIYRYVARLFGFKNESKPGPFIISQLKTFIEERNYTYKGVLNSLKYFYEVKKR